MIGHRLRSVVPATGCWFLAATLLAAMLLAAASASADDEVPLLRYSWKAGDEHVFQATITVDMDDKQDTISGMPTYKVVEADEDVTKIQFIGGATTHSQPKARPGAFPGFPRLPPRPPFPRPGLPGLGQRTLSINDRGRLIAEEGNTPLPYLLGDLAHLPLVPLPRGAEKSWAIERDTGISVTEDPGFRHPFFERQERKNVRAEEESLYSIVGIEGDVVTIKESYSLRALELVKKKPSMEMIGDVTIEFDRKLGGPVSYEGEFSLVFREGNSTTEIPIKVSIKRLDAEELEKIRLAGEKVRADAEAERRKPLDATEMATLLDDLNSDDRNRARRALTRLAGKEPLEADATLSAAIDRYVTHEDQFLRKSALDALAKWGTAESAPVIREAIKDDYVFARGSALAALARFPSKENAVAIAPLLSDNVNRSKAAEALIALGQDAEEATIELLADKQIFTQLEACKVLGVIGGDASVKALTPLAAESNPLVQNAAKKAIDDITARGANDQ
jgi:hypothetical protein